MSATFPKLSRLQIRDEFTEHAWALQVIRGVLRCEKLAEPSEDVGGARLMEGHPQPSDADLTKTWAALPTYGITEVEFHSGNKIIAVLQELLQDKPKEPSRA